MAKESDVHYVLPGTLNLRGKTRTVFFDFIKREFPNLMNDLQVLYKTGGVEKEYKNALYQRVNQLRDQYGLSSSYTKPIKEKLLQTNIQMSFFD